MVQVNPAFAALTLSPASSSNAGAANPANVPVGAFSSISRIPLLMIGASLISTKNIVNNAVSVIGSPLRGISVALIRKG